MSANSRLTVAVHALAWMELARRGAHERVTSDRIADSVNTNPVVIRRVLGSLRRAGIVAAQRGPDAGWSLTRAAERITLDEVHAAVQEPPLFAMHAGGPNQTCPVGRGIQPVLGRVYAGAAGALERELAATSIADVLDDILQPASSGS